MKAEKTLAAIRSGIAIVERVTAFIEEAQATIAGEVDPREVDALLNNAREARERFWDAIESAAERQRNRTDNGE